MDKALSTILLIVAALITVVMVINSVYPAVGESTSALSSASSKAAERIKSQFNIIHATGELDQDGIWQDSNIDGDFDIFIWVKNTGTFTINDIKAIDLFIGNDGNWTRVPEIDYANGSFPSWDYEIENGTEWGTSSTLKMEISHSSTQNTGNYHVKITIPNGLSDEFEFSF